MHEIWMSIRVFWSEWILRRGYSHVYYIAWILQPGTNSRIQTVLNSFKQNRPL